MRKIVMLAPFVVTGLCVLAASYIGQEEEKKEVTVITGWIESLEMERLPGKPTICVATILVDDWRPTTDEPVGFCLGHREGDKIAVRKTTTTLPNGAKVSDYDW